MHYLLPDKLVYAGFRHQFPVIFAVIQQLHNLVDSVHYLRQGGYVMPAFVCLFA